MNDPSDGQVVASDTVAMLNAQADGVRIELARLRQDLAQARQEASGQRNLQLVEANELLVTAALRANTIADAAVKTIAEMVTTSQRDLLTNTVTRAVLLDRIEDALALSRRYGTAVAVLFVDVDQLKSVNDTMGHAAGDRVLQLVARRLEEVIGPNDTVSRYGGDEFVVLLAELPESADAASVAASMLAALAVPAPIGAHVVGLSASIGIAIHPGDGTTGPELIAAADAAMYVIKRQGGSGFAHHDASMRADATRGIFTQQGKSQSGLRATAAHPDAASDTLREANERLVVAALNAQESRSIAEDAHGRQIRFMAMVAHELRNPLTPIRMAAGLLQVSGSDAPRLERLQGIIETQVTHLVRLVDDLLDGSRISTGKLRLQSDIIDINGVLASAVETSRPAMDARFQHFAVTLPQAPVYVNADPVRLAQIVSNLLDNASKYTPAGGHLALTLAVSGHIAEITVSDDGVGISRDALLHIFDLFVQDPGALTLHSGGLGIGLAVVRELVHAHGGHVVASSDGANLGSSFVVCLPLALAH